MVHFALLLRQMQITKPWQSIIQHNKINEHEKAYSKTRIKIIEKMAHEF